MTTQSLAHTVIVPALDIDGRLFSDRPMPARCRLERRVVWALLAHLETHGWLPVEVADTDREVTPTPGSKSVMEIVFNLDDAFVTFRNASGRKHWVRLILGNGVDVISDYSYGTEAGATFGSDMEAFDPELYA